MKPSDEFFSGTRYAIFGAKSPGRGHGPVLISALTKSGRTPIVIEPDGAPVKNAEVARSLRDAGRVDGVVLLPPAPWNDDAAAYTSDVVRQCKESGMSQLWVYVSGDPVPALAIAREAGLDPSDNCCPCLHVAGSGFPHNLHRLLLRLGKKD